MKWWDMDEAMKTFLICKKVKMCDINALEVTTTQLQTLREYWLTLDFKTEDSTME